ncbi:MAG TPA: L-threonylcarbamoyladenylate synthase [Candidatus Nitrosotenuis sp.]|nr:L-threonylcarbamoyladenylate synthase [Candidatus Nitrosotenuis sp.]
MPSKVIKVNPKKPDLAKIKEAAKVIRRGKLVAFPTETVYGLGANALNAGAVKRIFEAKGRPADNPLIIHIYDKDDLVFLAKEIPEIAERLTRRFWPGPLTIVLKKSEIVPKIVTGGLDTVAIRMPKNNIAQLLIREAGVPIAAPSANVAGRPSPTTAKHVLEDLAGKVDLIIDGGKTKIGIESTVVDLSGKTPMLLRPGGVTLEQLQKEIGKVNVHPIVEGRKTKSVHRSPGMKYRHYSPNAKIILIEGPASKVNAEISKLIKTLKNQRKRVGVLATQRGHQQRSDFTKYVGGSHSEIAANLFDAFREFDAKKIDVVLAQGITRKGLGLGIMNRLGKAAYKKIQV